MLHISCVGKLTTKSDAGEGGGGRGEGGILLAVQETYFLNSGNMLPVKV